MADDFVFVEMDAAIAAAMTSPNPSVSGTPAGPAADDDGPDDYMNEEGKAMRVIPHKRFCECLCHEVHMSYRFHFQRNYG